MSRDGSPLDSLRSTRSGGSRRPWSSPSRGSRAAGRTAARGDSLCHQLFVEDLVGSGLEAEIAPIRPIEGQDQEDHEADEPRKEADLDAVKSFFVHREVER